MTKAKTCKGGGWEWNPRVTFTLPGMWENVREWAHTFPSGLPLWGLESLQSPGFSKSNFKGQNSLDWRVHYIIGKFLKFKCLMYAHITHLSIYNTSYDRKKGGKSKCQFDFWPLKVRSHLELHVCRWSATYNWKILNKRYNFASNLTLIKGSYKKLKAFKVPRLPISRILGLSSWEF
jgi:hypothetical protein